MFTTSADWIQWREKDLSPAESRPWIEYGVKLAELRNKKFFVNSDWKQAALLGATGVHLTSRQTVSQVQTRPKEFLIGQSVHSLGEADKAAAAGADYLIAGPVYPPLSKDISTVPLGLDGLAEIVESVDIPVYAVGGVTPDREEELAGISIAGIAGITWATREIRKKLAGE